ncbi:nucleoside-diphosphate-sugar epimerase [Arthrobacter crystallopoietes BAB-32]|uniref:Nucleoside-diphosphate-sugar epimerase n=1 Tax=Arthrobacter crystallopoietes BAB-32 TaxID=1246476 RepID=N1VAP7_9MICC|nr:NAD-dependent epimerase/dehydratase family protein [Arthrobacter crystallopoietes]EMY35373.1 nucleoside-diphosphate-sugar epimerase [Arthrobacter crystallopoietes BAB-32]
MRIGIIGATGNVGTAVLRRIKQAAAERPDGVELVGISRRLPDQSQEPYDGVTWHSVDVASDAARERLAEALAGCDAVVHLAWVLQPNHDEDFMRRVNVDGTANALAAAADAGVRQFVCASSLGAYSPGPKDTRVDEGWPARGIASSHYSRFKGEQEALLDGFERRHPDIKVARMRTALIFQSDAGTEIGRYFLGRAIPKFFLDKVRTPLLPFPREFVFQAVHAEDAGDAYWRVLDQGASGAFNIAADPVITPQLLGGFFGAKRVLHTPVPLVRAAVGAAWSLRLLASDPGWVDMGRTVPVMDTSRAREVLGWEPKKTSVEALQEVLEGLSSGNGVAGSPPLHYRGRPES